jgi:hypothetical protein
MTTGSACNSECISDDLLEMYALGRLPEPAEAPLEEHLLICPACQIRLEQMDDYIRVVQAAAADLQNTLLLRRSTVNLAVSATAITAITPA